MSSTYPIQVGIVRVEQNHGINSEQIVKWGQYN